MHYFIGIEERWWWKSWTAYVIILLGMYQRNSCVLFIYFLWIVPQSSPECTSDSACPPTTACINQRCQNPCSISNPCGPGSECVVSLHRPVCDCPSGWAGNPQISCYKRKSILFLMIVLFSAPCQTQDIKIGFFFPLSNSTSLWIYI